MNNTMQNIIAALSGQRDNGLVGAWQKQRMPAYLQSVKAIQPQGLPTGPNDNGLAGVWQMQQMQPESAFQEAMRRATGQPQIKPNARGVNMPPGFWQRGR